jgi:hypothetical protein
VTVRLLLPLLLLALLPSARAQINTDGPIKMTPDLALAIPLVQVKHDVMLKFPILLNETTVLTPGMVLRNVYVPPTNDDSQNLAVAHTGSMEQAYSRSPAGGAEEQHMAPYLMHEIEHQRRIVWEVPVNFQLALAQLPTDAAHLIYSTNGDDLHLRDQHIDFLDGLFLGSPTGGVTVLAVENGNKTDVAGIKAGDQILSVGGKPVPSDLADFPTFYVAVRKEAEDGHETSFPMVVRSPGEAGSHTVNVATPTTIKSMLQGEGL